MASASIGSGLGSGLRRQLKAVAGLVSISIATASPVAASQWDLPAPRVETAAASLVGQSALLRTLAAQGLVAQGALTEARLPAWPAAAAGTPFTPAQSSPVVMTNFADTRVTAPQQRRSATGGPDVFGSVALAIGSTPYDDMWRRASAVDAQALGGWTGTFASLRDGDAEALLRGVNAWVNRRVDFVEDNVDGVPAEIWQNAAESLRRGRGDCEDYALAKLALLAALGFDRDDLYLVIARDLIARSHHAVLAVRTGGRLVILDNATDTLIEGDRVNDYRPIFSYSAAGRWIHGYPDSPSRRPLQIAAAATAIAAP